MSVSAAGDDKIKFTCTIYVNKEFDIFSICQLFNISKCDSILSFKCTFFMFILLNKIIHNVLKLTNKDKYYIILYREKIYTNYKEI